MTEPNMNQEDILDENAQVQMSPEEYAKAKLNAINELRSEVKYLKVEEEYWRLLADIEEHRTRKVTMLMRRSQFYQKQPDPAEVIKDNKTAEEQTPPTQTESINKRTLKTD